MSETKKSSWLTEHIDSVEEGYFEHMGHAFSFGFRMMWAGLCCSLHGIFPFWFCTTGRNCIETLHDEMVVNRKKLSKAYKAREAAALETAKSDA